MDDHRGLFYLNDFGTLIAIATLVQYTNEP